jgi:dUTP pyrophosphatase
VQVPADCYARIAPRSGLAVKHGIDIGAGVVDSDYLGIVGVVMFNTGDNDFQVNAGDRIAQLICERIYTPVWEEVSSLANFEETERGDGGFGSTGL